MVNACDSFIWNGTEYTESGDYEQTFTSSMGCDSIVTLHLTIESAVGHEFTVNACDSFIWNGTEHTESGDFTQTFTTPLGCDSIVTLHLTINPSTTHEFMISTCDSYIWNGTEFNAAIEQKQVAEQNLLKTETEQKQAIVVAKAEAEKKEIAAKAEANAILAKAEAQASANQKLNDSLTGLVLQDKMLEKWDGVLPKVSGSDSSLLLNIDDATGIAATPAE